MTAPVDPAFESWARSDYNLTRYANEETGEDQGYPSPRTTAAEAGWRAALVYAARHPRPEVPPVTATTAGQQFPTAGGTETKTGGKR